MPYLRGYQHDAFVSYAHAPRLTEWSQALVKELEEELNYVLGCKHTDYGVDLWMDPQLLGNRPLETHLKEEIEGSALLIIIMSRFYLDSEWCGKEFASFEAASRLKTAAHTRTFVVRAEPTHANLWPRQLQSLSGYRFHPERGSRPFGFPLPKRDDEFFYAALFTLVDQIKLQMDLVHRKPDATDTLTDTGPLAEALPRGRVSAVRTVFIDGKPVNERIERELTDLLAAHQAEIRTIVEYGKARRDPASDNQLLEELTRAKAGSDGIVFMRGNGEASTLDWIRRYVAEIVPTARRVRGQGALPSPAIIDAIEVDGPEEVNGVPVFHFARPDFATRLGDWVDALGADRNPV